MPQKQSNSQKETPLKRVETVPPTLSVLDLVTSEDLIARITNGDRDIALHSAEELLNSERNPATLATAAQLVMRHSPGGRYYQALLWAEIERQLVTPAQDRRFAPLCRGVGIEPKDGRRYGRRGRAIRTAIAQLLPVEVVAVRELPDDIWNVIESRRLDMVAYLKCAIKLWEGQPRVTLRTIHNAWCQRYGTKADSLDIIKPSDWWAFGRPKWQQDTFFGAIPGEIYANALYYFAPQQGIAVDPMAGSGMLERVYSDRHLWQKDRNLDLTIHLFDLYPQQEGITYHDARVPLPIRADWVFLDPPYYGQSSHLYGGKLAQTNDYDLYLIELRRIIQALAQSMNDKGILCLLLPKWSAAPGEENYNVPDDAADICEESGLLWIDAAYVSRGRQQESGGGIKNNAAKRQLRMRSDTCVLNVFQRWQEDS